VTRENLDNGEVADEALVAETPDETVDSHAKEQGSNGQEAEDLYPGGSL
jgi:hypothetical protein